jgi:hypothetical protein
VLIARWFRLEIHPLRLNWHILTYSAIHKLPLTSIRENANLLISASFKPLSYI